jgi:two-component system OmpR family response regulator
MAHAGRSSTAPLKVLIADDSPPVAEMLKELLEDPGRVEVVGWADTQQAVIEAVLRDPPDVVILDLQLRTGTGTEVIRALRAEAALAAVKILVTSNHVSPQLRAGCLELGADGYFDKVKELGVLVDAVAALAG